MSRTIVHTLAFNSPEMVEGALKCHYDGYYERYLIWCGFPGYSVVEYSKLALKYHCDFIIIGNKGVSENWNQVAKLVSLKDDDVLIGLDPDERPQQQGWIEAIADVMREDPTVGYITTNKVGYEPEGNINDFTIETIAGHRCRNYHSQIAWILGGFSGKCLREIGGIKQENKLYGYLEHATNAAMKEKGFRWLMLEDFTTHHLPSDDKLTLWKNLNRDRKDPPAFEEWVNTIN